MRRTRGSGDKVGGGSQRGIIVYDCKFSEPCESLFHLARLLEQREEERLLCSHQFIPQPENVVYNGAVNLEPNDR